MESANNTLSRIAGITLEPSTSSGSMESTSSTHQTQIRVSHNYNETRDDNVVMFLDDEKSPDVLLADNESRRKIHKELARLQFDNPGDKANGQPTLNCNRRQRRNPIVEPKKPEENIYHDRKGQLIVPGAAGPYDICDCLRKECSGCHWPCHICGGRRCGPICQQGRPKFALCMEEQGTKKKPTFNPYIDEQYLGTDIDN